MIYTHTHFDHYGGVKGVIDPADVASGKVPIIAPGTIASFDKRAKLRASRVRAPRSVCKPPSTRVTPVSVIERVPAARLLQGANHTAASTSATAAAGSWSLAKGPARPWRITAPTAKAWLTGGVLAFSWTFPLCCFWCRIVKLALVIRWAYLAEPTLFPDVIVISLDVVETRRS